PLLDNALLGPDVARMGGRLRPSVRSTQVCGVQHDRIAKMITFARVPLAPLRWYRHAQCDVVEPFPAVRQFADDAIAEAEGLAVVEKMTPNFAHGLCALEFLQQVDE